MLGGYPTTFWQICIYSKLQKYGQGARGPASQIQLFPSVAPVAGHKIIIATLVASSWRKLDILHAAVLGSMMVNKYSCRTAAIAGAALRSAGYILSAFAPNIPYLFVTLGFLSGLPVPCQFVNVSLTVWNIGRAWSSMWQPYKWLNYIYCVLHLIIFAIYLVVFIC